MHRETERAVSSAKHLTEEQLSDLLLDQGTAAAQQHVSLCQPCRRELDHLRASIADFNDLSLAWAEHRAPRIPVPSRAAIRWNAVPAWSAVGTAAVSAIILLGAHERHIQSNVSSLAAEASAQASIVADDNRLLLAIDQDIRVSHQTPADLSALGLAQTSPARTASGLEN